MGKPTTGRVFVQFKNQKFHPKCPIGHNSVGDVGKKVASWIGLENPERYTGHCWRRTAATVFADGGGSNAQMKRKFGWASETTATEYIDNSKKSIATNADILQTGMEPSTEPLTEPIIKKPRVEPPAQAGHEARGLNFHNCSNIVINMLPVPEAPPLIMEIPPSMGPQPTHPPSIDTTIVDKFKSDQLVVAIWPGDGNFYPASIKNVMNHIQTPNGQSFSVLYEVRFDDTPTEHHFLPEHKIRARDCFTE